MHDFYDGEVYFDQDDMIAHELDEDWIQHYGVPRRSGRYPWGSGDNPYQHEDFYDGFLSRVQGFRKDGLSEEDQAKQLGFASVKEYRNAVAEAERINSFNRNLVENLAATGKTHHNAGSELDRLAQVKDRIRRETGLTKENEINNLAMKEFGFEKTNDFRQWKGRLEAAERQERYDFVRKLKEEGLSATEIAKRASKEWGYNVIESTIRGYTDNKAAAEKMTRANRTADFLREQVAQKGIIDVGKGTNLDIPDNDFDVPVSGVTQGVWKSALKQLQDEGYSYYSRLEQPQVGNANRVTPVSLLAPPGTTFQECYDALRNDTVESIKDYRSEDHGETYATVKMEKPVSIDSKRICVNYADQGGIEQDGVIEIRPGVKDLDLNGAAYAQVRIAVDGKSYLKGMAVYSDNIPPGYDIRFNSNKPAGTPLEKVLKPLEKKQITLEDGTKQEVIDWENPFGAALKRNGSKILGAGQYTYTDDDGKEKLSAINKIREEDDWADYKGGNNRLPAQFLSKQPESLVNNQIHISLANKKIEWEEINAITEPTVKRYFLNEFASSCDKDASTLSCAAIPGQKYKVILPINSLKPTECYCPSYPAGEKLALIRFPHQATFEIPIVTNNLNNKEGQKFYSGKVGQDMIGIHYKTAAHLSGADFDGDTALVIPMRAAKALAHEKYYAGLEGFDPKVAYRSREEVTFGKDGEKIVTYYNEQTGKAFKPMSKQEKGKQMGIITNLITDISARENPDPEELARAIRQAYVVIDAEKHHLDWKQCERDNGIDELKKKYQSHPERGVGKDGEPKYGGSATLFSRAHGPARIPETQGSPWVNLKENEGKFVNYTDKAGNKQRIPKYDPTKPEGVLLYKPSNRQVPIKDQRKGMEYYDENGVKHYPSRRDPVTGEVLTKLKTVETVNMYTVTDAKQLLGNDGKGYNNKELMYAEYANSLKDMANRARIQAAHIETQRVNPSAKQIYKEEIQSLNEKLRDANVNSPRERAAQREALNRYEKYKLSHPNASPKDLKKARARLVPEGRANVGAESVKIKISEKEMEAIRAGAIASTTIDAILTKSDPDTLRERVTPKDRPKMTPAKLAKAQAMIDNSDKSKGTNKVTLSMVADELDVSVSTLSKYLKDPSLLNE